MKNLLKILTFKHPLLADLAASVAAFFLLSSISKSLGAVIGAMVTGLLVNFSLIFGARYYAHRQNPKQ